LGQFFQERHHDVDVNLITLFSIFKSTEEKSCQALEHINDQRKFKTIIQKHISGLKFLKNTYFFFWLTSTLLHRYKFGNGIPCTARAPPRGIFCSSSGPTGGGMRRGVAVPRRRSRPHVAGAFFSSLRKPEHRPSTVQLLAHPCWSHSCMVKGPEWRSW
jgi:hypothetical protein